MIENINHNQGFDELANNISKSLSSMKNSGGVIHYYWTLGNYAEELIKMKLGNEGSNMPVDIESLAKKMDIEIRDKRLNSYLMQNIWNGDVTYIEEIQNVKALNRRIGQLAIRKDSYTNEVEKIIYTDESVPISAKRYAIANEITHYLLYLCENRDVTSPAWLQSRRYPPAPSPRRIRESRGLRNQRKRYTPGWRQ